MTVDGEVTGAIGPGLLVLLGVTHDDTPALADRMADVPVYLIDERLSTVTAASHLRQGGIDSRNQRSVIDQAAAVVILQQYLDSRRARS